MVCISTTDVGDQDGGYRTSTLASVSLVISRSRQNHTGLRLSDDMKRVSGIPGFHLRSSDNAAIVSRTTRDAARLFGRNCICFLSPALLDMCLSSTLPRTDVPNLGPDVDRSGCGGSGRCLHGGQPMLAKLECLHPQIDECSMMYTS